MRTFKALSILLSYPDEETREAVPVLRQALAEGVIPVDGLAALEQLLAELQAGDPWDLQERYVMLFDRSRTLSLNLFEHVHGESRDRGQAMVDLVETYRAGGFELAGRELPDHLPVLLEFLSTRPLAEARAILADAGHILVALAGRLRRRDPAYAAVLDALVAIAGDAVARVASHAPASGADEDPQDLAALDAAWEEAQVTFGPDPNAGCPVGREILARMELSPAPARAGT